jgi:hypothetical protein
MSDEDIIASEKYFQEHKVTTGPVAAVVLNVNNSVWSSMGVVVSHSLFPCRQQGFDTGWRKHPVCSIFAGKMIQSD